MHESVGSNHEAAVALHYMHYNFCPDSSDIAGDTRNGGWTCWAFVVN